MTAGFEKDLLPDSFLEGALQEGCNVARILRLAGREITVVAFYDGHAWKATIDAPGVFPGLEFHGLVPETALNQAEAFVRRAIWDLR